MKQPSPPPTPQPRSKSTMRHSAPPQPTMPPFLVTPEMCYSALSSTRPHSMSECIVPQSIEDCPVVCGTPSLRRRSHIRRSYGARSSTGRSVLLSESQKGRRPGSAPAAMPEPLDFLPQDPSSSKSHTSESRNNNAPRATTARASGSRLKPYLHPIVTSNLTAIPKRKFVVPTGPPARELALVKPTSSSISRLSRPTESPAVSTSTLTTKPSVSQAVPTPRRSIRGPRPAPIRRTGTPIAVMPLEAPAMTRSSNPHAPQSIRKQTSESNRLSPITIWSQDSGMHTGIPPSREASLFINIISPTDTGHNETVSRAEQNDPAFVDWTAVEHLLRQTVIVETSDSQGGSDDSAETMTEDDSPNTSLTSTPTAAPSSSKSPPLSHMDGTKGASGSEASRNTRPPNSHYGGPWGRATQPAQLAHIEGGSTNATIGDLLIQRWNRAHAALNAASNAASEGGIIPRPVPLPLAQREPNHSTKPRVRGPISSPPSISV